MLRQNNEKRALNSTPPHLPELPIQELPDQGLFIVKGLPEVAREVKDVEITIGIPYSQ